MVYSHSDPPGGMSTILCWRLSINSRLPILTKSGSRTSELLQCRPLSRIHRRLSTCVIRKMRALSGFRSLDMDQSYPRCEDEWALHGRRHPRNALTRSASTPPIVMACIQFMSRSSALITAMSWNERDEPLLDERGDTFFERAHPALDVVQPLLDLIKAMAPDGEAGGRSTRLLFGGAGLLERVVNLDQHRAHAPILWLGGARQSSFPQAAMSGGQRPSRNPARFRIVPAPAGLHIFLDVI